MLIRVGYDLVFDAPSPVSTLLLLYTHPSRVSHLRHPERLRTEPEVPVREFTDGFGNHAGRLVAPAGKIRLHYDAVVEDTGEPDILRPDARQVPVDELPDEALQFLLSSRYCEVDLLSDI